MTTTRKSIFILTTLGKLIDEPGWPASEGVAGFERFRSWAWFSSLKEAVDSLEDSPAFWHEAGYYNHIVIEEVSEGGSHFHKEHWFKLDGDEWVSCEKPKEVSKIVGWSLG